MISNNTISETRSGLAGGIYIYDGSSATVLSNRITNNWSDGSGGGIRIENSTPQIIDNFISGNSAPHLGGGLYVFASAVYCSSNVIRSCRSLEGGGGGAYLQHVPVGTRFVDNEWRNCSGDFGGGILIRDDAFATFERETFDNCSAEKSGGGIAALRFSEISVIDCAFENCSAGESGGGIWTLQTSLVLLGSDATADPSAARFTNCAATDFGGGLYAEDAITTGVIDKIRVTACTAGQWGGGLYILHSPFLITENVLEDCVASEGGGVALRTQIRSRHEQSIMINNTIFGGSGTAGSGNPAGGVTLAAISTDNICRFGGNIIAGTLQGVSLRCRKGGTPAGAGLPTVNCSTFFNDPGNSSNEIFGNRCVDAVSSDGTNQDGVDPVFCSPTVGYRLDAGSPAVASNCALGGGKLDRGAYADGDHCGTVVSVEPLSWGQIKVRYR